MTISLCQGLDRLSSDWPSGRTGLLFQDGVQSGGVEAAPIGQLVDRYRFGCRKAVDQALNAWDIVGFDDRGHGLLCVVVGINNTE
jgi:hypothetical protein